MIPIPLEGGFESNAIASHFGNLTKITCAVVGAIALAVEKLIRPSNYDSIRVFSVRVNTSGLAS